MDPYYFLNLDIEYSPETLEEDKCELYEYIEILPNGFWIIGDLNNEEYKIIYNDDKYDKIIFEYKTKIIYLYKKEKLDKKLKMIFEEIKI